MKNLRDKYKSTIGYSIEEENLNIELEGVSHLITFSKDEYIDSVMEATVDKMATPAPAKALIKHGKEWYDDILQGVNKEFIYRNMSNLTDILTDLFLLDYCNGNIK